MIGITPGSGSTSEACLRKLVGVVFGFGATLRSGEPIFGTQLQATSYKLQAASYKLQATSYKLQATGEPIFGTQRGSMPLASADVETETVVEGGVKYTYITLTAALPGQARCERGVNEV